MQRKRLIAVVTALLLVGIISVLPLTAQDEAAESEGELLAVLEAYLDAWVNDLDALPQFLTEDVVRHHLRGPDMDAGELVEQFGIDEIAADATGFQAALPGVGFVVNHSVERNNYIWAALSTTELPDTDGVVLDFVLMARFSDGKIAEIWAADDELAMLSLLDAFPEMEE